MRFTADHVEWASRALVVVTLVVYAVYMTRRRQGDG
jgi:hypothetical protein